MTPADYAPLVRELADLRTSKELRTRTDKLADRMAKANGIPREIMEVLRDAGVVPREIDPPAIVIAQLLRARLG